MEKASLVLLHGNATSWDSFIFLPLTSNDSLIHKSGAINMSVEDLQQQ